MGSVAFSIMTRNESGRRAVSVTALLALAGTALATAPSVSRAAADWYVDSLAERGGEQGGAAQPARSAPPQ